MPSIAQLRPLPNEIKIDDVIAIITTYLDEPINKVVEPFDKCEITKLKIILQINAPIIKRRENE